ncbi:MAG: hypothetical protein AAB426_05765 [Myxococcota bacterium]
MTKRLLIVLGAMTASTMVVPQPAKACFDTHLILLGRPITYPEGEGVILLNPEYSFNRWKHGEADSLETALDVDYGVTDKLTVSGGLISGDKLRQDFEVDQAHVGLWYGAYRTPLFGLTPAIEHASTFDAKDSETDFALIGTINLGDAMIVVHPKATFVREGGTETRLTGGAHLGAFYRLGLSGILGVGTEYIDSAATASLFLGAFIGEHVYFGWEAILGLNDEAQSFGMANTLKYMF